MLYPSSTSNHNIVTRRSCIYQLCYILLLHQTTTFRPDRFLVRPLCYILLLHQTTTDAFMRTAPLSCVISFFYIKPQLRPSSAELGSGCVISFFYIKPQQLALRSCRAICCVISFFYIKPQHGPKTQRPHYVVLYPSSTSNHNSHRSSLRLLCVVLYPSSTSNHNTPTCQEVRRSVVLYPSSTSNHNNDARTDYTKALCYILLLHQTTTLRKAGFEFKCCVISFFYIKPQHKRAWKKDYLLCYILLLHQTTTVNVTRVLLTSCVISFFYIKPQPHGRQHSVEYVVLYPSSTSNHNTNALADSAKRVVLYPSSTSNHNCRNSLQLMMLLCYILLLHQTTTNLRAACK